MCCSLSSSSAEKVIKFPLMPMIAGLVVVFLTALLAVFSRWSRITKVTYTKTHGHLSQGLTLAQYKLNPLMLCVS